MYLEIIVMDLKEVFAEVVQVSKKTKTPAYVVGGFVRDFLLGIESRKDIDFVVEGSGLAFARSLDEVWKEKGSLVEFPDFDTARYIIVDEETGGQTVLEFAGARTEKYESHSRKPIVAPTTLENDLARRDFTANAMAADAQKVVVTKTGKVTIKEIVDPFGGREDLERKILRTPLDPDITFSDDPLRMLRAVRFAAQLGFAIEPKTLEAIHRNRERMSIISGERIQEELFKLLATSQPGLGLTLMFQTHLMDIVLPEVSALDGVEEIFGHQHKNNLVHSIKVVENIAEHSTKPELRLAGLFHDIGKPGTKAFVAKIGWTFHGHEHLGKKMVYGIAKRLKFSKDLTNYLAKLIRWHLQPIALMDEGITDSAVRRLIVTMGDLLDDLLVLGAGDITTGNPYKKEKRLKNYVHLREKIAEVMEKDKLRAFQSPLRGEEIISLTGLKPGPTIGKIKKAIEEAILEGEIPNEYEAAKEYFFKIKDAYLSRVNEWEK